MAWHFDRVLTSLGQHTPVTTTGPQPDIAVNGKLLWLVTPAAGEDAIHCYDIVHIHTYITPDDVLIDSIPEETFAPFLKVDSPRIPCYVAAYSDKAYITQSDYNANPAEFDEVIVVSTSGQIDESIELPVAMRSNLIIDDGKLWMVSRDINDSFQQTLYWYDLSTKSFGSAPIPVRHQTQVRSLVRDHAGHVLVADYNNLSITKFTNKGVFVSTTRMAADTGGANREPSQFALDENRNLYVSSYNGMISKMDTTTDTFTWFSNGLGDVSAMADDGTFQWVGTQKRASSVSYAGTIYVCKESHIARGSSPDLTKWDVDDSEDAEAIDGVWTAGSYYVDGKGDLLRINKTTQSMRHFSTTERDVQIVDDASVTVTGSAINKVLVTPSFVAATKDGNLTVPSYTWAVTNACRIIGFPFGSMYRQNFYEMKGVAMMSVGTYDYTGD